MFTNANIICDTIITAEEFLPDESKGQEMSYCQHPGYYGKKLFIIIHMIGIKK